MNFPADFDSFVRGFIYPHECAYSPGHDGDMNFVVTENVPDDSGGETKWGIDTSSHPSVDIGALTAETAEMIYWQDFVASQSPMLPGRLSLYHFDCAVNLGANTAIQVFQNAIGDAVDGVLGPQTLLSAWVAWGNAPQTLVSSLLDARAGHYRALASCHPADAQFLTGWLNRVADLRSWQFP